LAQAIGRFGNFFNAELYGQPTNLPWGINIDGVKFHPLFLYESLGCLLIFICLNFILSKSRKTGRVEGLDGRLFFAYIALYGLLRFFLEPLRIESWIINSINVTQALSIILIIAGLTGIILINRKNRPNQKSGISESQIRQTF